MKPTSKRAFSLLLSGTFVVLALFIFLTFAWPEYQNIMLARGELLARSTLLDQQQAAMAQVQNLISKYKGEESQLKEVVSLALPPAESMASVISQLNAIAQSSGMVIKSIAASRLAVQPAQNTVSKGYGTLRLSVDILGSYESLKLFLQGIETNIRLMDLKNMSISNAGTKSSPDFYSYSLVIDTYYQPK